MVLLHGTLNIKIIEARKLINADGLASKVSGVSKTVGKLLKGMERSVEKLTGIADLSDPYAYVQLGNRRLIRSSVIYNSLSPRWNEEFIVLLADEVDEFQVVVADKDMISKAILGMVQVSGLTLVRGQPVNGWYKLLGPNKDSSRDRGEICLFMEFVPARYMGPTPDLTMPNVYFPLRRGCRVTLYADAHCPTGLLPQIPLDAGDYYESHCAWEDMFDAITNARHLIYITGWSVVTHITLVRDNTRRPQEQTFIRLGELLITKANQGVRVLIMPWDDQTSVKGMSAFIGGVMGTSDEATRNFFNNTPVKVFLCPREGSNRDGVSGGQQLGRLIYTHHQKAVVVDAPNPNVPGGVTLTGFVGGLDLCGGRWDTANHELFATLNSYHMEDFRQSSIPGCDRENGGPRLPWHDLHSRVEGPVAFDVHNNFEQRWLQQAGGNRAHDLLPLGNIPGLQMPSRSPDDPTGAIYQPNDPRSWCVQILRSIDGRSVADLVKCGPLPPVPGIIPNKGLQVERTVHDAHIHAIRRANKFIYIESQYFLGSSQMWDSYQDCGCNHLIPVEIALKVAAKIRANERFAAYILIPLFPEGDPNSEPVNEILFWQAQTIRMMYRIITEALISAGNPAHPQEYLNFYCLGNRESPSNRPIHQLATKQSTSGLKTSKSVKAPTAYHQKVLQTRRFMVYIHSKMMIVDDEYIILGSANVNQRSMDGTRDSEIAIGAFQPANTVYSRGGRLPRGDIHGYRMQLWAEHTGVKRASPEVYVDPSAPECVNAMSSAARWNWDAYLAPEPQELPYGHLLPYPITVNRDGTIAADSMSAVIPDTTISILGKKSGSLPNDLST